MDFFFFILFQKVTLKNILFQTGFSIRLNKLKIKQNLHILEGGLPPPQTRLWRCALHTETQIVHSLKICGFLTQI